MINITNTMIPEQLADLPNKIGIVIHINRNGEAVALTASENVDKRVNPAKMERLYDAAMKGKLHEEAGRTAKWVTDDMQKYPEAFKKVIFIPFPTYKEADATAKILRKSMEIQAKDFYGMKTYNPDDETRYEQAIIRYHSENPGYVDGLTALKSVGFEKIDYSNRGIGYQGMKGNAIHRRLVEEGVLKRTKITYGFDEERSGRVAVYGYALADSTTEKATDEFINGGSQQAYKLAIGEPN